MSTSSPFPILETNRLVLRQLTVDDSENWFKNLSDDEVAVLIGMEPLENVEDSKSIINSFIDRYEKKIGMAWAIILKEDESFIGTCSYEKIDSHNL
ncbi:MAG: GNAT family N-acetyltransferase, partial [Candidatus Thorarchaeota archaeon]